MNESHQIQGIDVGDDERRHAATKGYDDLGSVVSLFPSSPFPSSSESGFKGSQSTLRPLKNQSVKITSVVLDGLEMKLTKNGTPKNYRV